MEQKKLCILMAWIVFTLVLFGAVFIIVGTLMESTAPWVSYAGFGLFALGVAVFMAFNFFHNRRNGKV